MQRCKYLIVCRNGEGQVEKDRPGYQHALLHISIGIDKEATSWQVLAAMGRWLSCDWTHSETVARRWFPLDS